MDTVVLIVNAMIMLLVLYVLIVILQGMKKNGTINRNQYIANVRFVKGLMLGIIILSSIIYLCLSWK